MFPLVASIIVLLIALTLFKAIREGFQTAPKTTEMAAERDHFAKQLREIEEAHENSRLNADEFAAAKLELARDYKHLRAERERKSVATQSEQKVPAMRLQLLLLCGILPLLAIAGYLALGQPNLPSAPLSARTDLDAPMDLEQAVAAVEQRLSEFPDDLEGWQALAPILMRQQRFSDAANAFAQINRLTEPTSQSLTAEAEARLFASKGEPDDQTIALLEAAISRDETNPEPAFYLANLLMRLEKWEDATKIWQQVLSIGSGQEEWYPIAQRGLLTAQNDGQVPADLATQAHSSNEPSTTFSSDDLGRINAMVAGLDERLELDGGSVEEHEQLIRSFVVLQRTEDAKMALDRALNQFEDTEIQERLVSFARSLGLSS